MCGGIVLQKVTSTKTTLLVIQTGQIHTSIVVLQQHQNTTARIQL